MKLYSTILILFLLIANHQSRAQDAELIEVKDISVTTNTIEGFSLSILFPLDVQVDDEYWIDKTHRPDFFIVYSGNSVDDCPLTVRPFVSGKGFGFQISGFNERTINRLQAKDNQITLKVAKDIRVKFRKATVADPDRFGLISKSNIDELISQKFTITDADRSDYVSALNNFYYYQNQMDFGIQPAKDSIKTSYYLTVKLQNRYNAVRSLKCASPTSLSKVSLYWNLTTRVSTNSADSLNFINYYPLVATKSNYDSRLPHEFTAKIGHESNQTFSQKRAAVDGSYTLIIPNLVNFTTASANRLRLKPIINAGIKGYYDYSNQLSEFYSGQAYIKGYYYIPVFNNYAIIIDANSFYDFSHQRNPDHKILNNYTITLGAEIPKTGFKAMIKYVNGISDINFKQGQIIAIGLLMDFFQETNK